MSPLNNKRLIALIVLFAILDPFVTYHSFWQRTVVVATVGVVVGLITFWAREDERKKRNPPQSY